MTTTSPSSPPPTAFPDGEERASSLLHLDEDALFCTLALAPGTFSRNQNFEFFKDARVRRVKRRAIVVRAIAQWVADLQQATSTTDPSEKPIGTARVVPSGDGFQVELDVPEMGFRRRSWLTSIERDVLDYLVARLSQKKAPDAQARIEQAIARAAVLAAD